MYLMCLADSASAGKSWVKAYLKNLEEAEDCMLDIAPHAIKKFLFDAANTEPPARWDEDGVFECVDRTGMLRALYWFEPETPESALANLRLYGFSTKNPESPRNPEFRTDSREDNLRIMQRYDKFTRPQAHTKDEFTYA